MDVFIYHMDKQHQHLQKYVNGEYMKWIYITIGLFIAIIMINILQSPTMYTSKGQLISPIHMGVENEK